MNDYLRETSGEEITAKDFRTWAGTNLAAAALQALDHGDDPPRKKTVLRALKEVASALGNTLAVCRKCYVHPAIVDGYLDRSLLPALNRSKTAAQHPGRGLTADEAAVMAFLNRRLTRIAGTARRRPQQRRDMRRKPGRSVAAAARRSA